MNYEHILTELENSTLIITINRESKLNALTYQTIQEVGSAVKEANETNSARCIIITGAGSKAFVAGADISEFASFSVPEGEKLAREGQVVFDYIENSDIPVIAAVNGFALGGGCELAMACHMRVASDNAKFGQPEVKLGLIPGYGGTQRLPQLIGKNKAIELLITADMLDANEALKWGLVNHVVSSDELMVTCKGMANKIAKQAPLAVSACIKTVNSFYNKNEDGFEEEKKMFGESFGTNDFKEGSQAFLNKRKPEFTGA
ncbi:MAG: enoyl-CoA hydratase [Bacteroidia bacterium]|nr:enoyl-CoA hydratase [Bacteroidia bacterium]